MVSALTGVTVRQDVAMTGEISLRGRVMRIGGLKEKTMAALRHGISTVIIPEENLRDLEEIDQTVRSRLNFVTARTVDTVLDTALVRQHEMGAPVLTEIPREMKKSHKPSIRQ
jgi:ATP-dependent Lon protease